MKEEIQMEKNLAEYIITKIIAGNVFLLANEKMVKIQEQESSIKIERTGIKVQLKKYNKDSILYFFKKDDKLKEYSSDIYIPAGANWETLFGFYIDDDLPIKIHVYFIGKRFDLDRLSEMIYSLFTDAEDCIKTAKISLCSKQS